MPQMEEQHTMYELKANDGGFHMPCESENAENLRFLEER